jgi:glycosyltransferase involved in cell wall biosynthesis
LKSISISLITIVNNEQVFDEFKKSLLTQENINYELIKIENCHHEYASARVAYNVAAQKAKGEILVFCHPDIRFLDSKSLDNIIDYAKSLFSQKVGVIGIAGTPFELVNQDRIILSTIVHGDLKKPAGQKITQPIEVQTLDECFFILKKDFWKLFPLSAKKGWHLYCVEECLLANAKGYKNYVVPAHIWHTSDGKSENYQYYLYLKHLIKQYRQQLPRINTTVKMWPTRGLKAKWRVNYWLLNRWVKQQLHLKVK